MMVESGGSSKKKSDLGLRLASAIILGPLVLLITYFGGVAFSALLLVACLLFLWEWFSITGTKQAVPAALLGYLALIASTVFVQLGYANPAFAIILLGACAVYASSKFTRVGRWAAEGVLYSGLSLFALLIIRSGTEGLLFTFFLLFVVWATDIFAYFTGRTLGGPKLWSKVSPKKTWSGAIGGLILAVLFGTGVVFMAGAQVLFPWVILAVGLSIVSQAGDLLESAIKRRFDVKDSSGLIPGHGGVMDRIDGLVAAAIFAVLVGLISGGTLADPIAGLGLS